MFTLIFIKKKLTMTTQLVAKQIQPGFRQQTLQPQVGQVLGT